MLKYRSRLVAHLIRPAALYSAGADENIARIGAAILARNNAGASLLPGRRSNMKCPAISHDHRAAY